MKLSVQDTSQRKAQKAFDEIRLQYEREEEERLEREAKAKELAKTRTPMLCFHSPSTWKSGCNPPAPLWPPQPIRATPT